MSARERAEKNLEHKQQDLGYNSAGGPRAMLRTGRRIGWALLDVADAIREHTAALDRIEQRQHRRAREGRA